MPGRDRAHHLEQVVEDDDVRIRVAEEVVVGLPLDALEHRAQERGAERVRVDARKTLDAELPGGLRSAGLVPTEEHLAAGTEGEPAAHGVPLDHAHVPGERLGDGKDGQHVSAPTLASADAGPCMAPSTWSSLPLGAAWARWPSGSSKPVRSCSPRLGRFDSGAAPSMAKATAGP